MYIIFAINNINFIKVLIKKAVIYKNNYNILSIILFYMIVLFLRINKI